MERRHCAGRNARRLPWSQTTAASACTRPSRSAATAAICRTSSPPWPDQHGPAWPASPTCTTPPTHVDDRSVRTAGGRAGAGSSPVSGAAEFLHYLQSRLAPQAALRPRTCCWAARYVPVGSCSRSRPTRCSDREQFRLQAEQQTAYSLVMRAVERAVAARRRKPSSSSVARARARASSRSSLLGELSRQGRSVLHATGSSAFTQTLRKVAGARAPRVQAMFGYFNQFGESQPNDLDVLICDEAHRIRETSANRYTRASARTGTPQVDELLDAARVPVFLLDEHQVVRPGRARLGRRDHRALPSSSASLVRVVHLDGQFRCGGSGAYETWVLRLLGLAPGGPDRVGGRRALRRCRLADSPAEMERAAAVQQDARLLGARISAGYCWPWSDARPDGTLVDDVVIGDWKRPVEQQEGHRCRRRARPPVLVERPRRLRSGRLRLHRAGLRVRLVRRHPRARSRLAYGPLGRPARQEPRQRSEAGAEPDEFDAAVRNTYKVLLTRGMIGTLVVQHRPGDAGFAGAAGSRYQGRGFAVSIDVLTPGRDRPATRPPGAARRRGRNTPLYGRPTSSTCGPGTPPCSPCRCRSSRCSRSSHRSTGQGC